MIALNNIPVLVVGCGYLVQIDAGESKCRSG